MINYNHLFIKIIRMEKQIKNIDCVEIINEDGGFRREENDLIAQNIENERYDTCVGNVSLREFIEFQNQF